MTIAGLCEIAHETLTTITKAICLRPGVLDLCHGVSRTNSSIYFFKKRPGVGGYVLRDVCVPGALSADVHE